MQLAPLVLLLSLESAAAGRAAAPPVVALTPEPASARRVMPRASAPKLLPRAKPPKTPAGMPPCAEPLKPVQDLPRAMGETVRYLVDVDGLSVGTIDFKIERRGTYAGQRVTEYRSLFKLDSLVSTFVPVEGRAASLVPEVSFVPLLAMNRYVLSDTRFEESQTFSRGGHAVLSKRSKDGKTKDERRVFPGPAIDFVSGFYMLRSLPDNARGCAIIYGNQRAYTVWLEPEGSEQVRTPVGSLPARRYRVSYASDKSKKPATGTLWMGEAPLRLPFRVELTSKNRLEARIHLYETGQ